MPIIRFAAALRSGHVTMSLCHHVRLAVTDEQDAEDWVKTKSALLDIAIHPVLSEKLRHIIKVANLWTPIAWTYLVRFPNPLHGNWGT